MPKTWKENVLAAVSQSSTGVASLAAIKRSTNVTASNKRFLDKAIDALVKDGALIKVKASFKLGAAPKDDEKAVPKAAEPKAAKPKKAQSKSTSAPPPPVDDAPDTMDADSMAADDDEPLQIGETCLVPGSTCYYEVTRDVRAPCLCNPTVMHPCSRSSIIATHAP